jgi:hypothetical protein
MCSELGDRPYPASDAQLARQLKGFASRWVNPDAPAKPRSHISVRGYLLCIFKHLRTIGRPLAEPLRADVWEHYADLAKRFPATVTRAMPLTIRVLDPVCAYLEPYAARGFRYARQMLAIIAVGVRGKLRSGAELMRLPWQAFGCDGSFLTAWVTSRKNRKTVLSADDLIHLPSSPGFGDPLAAMRSLAQLDGHTIPPTGHPPARGLPPAFRPIHANGSPAAGDPGRWLGHELRRLFSLCGMPLPPALMKLAGHGFRRGGATEELECGAPRDDVRKGGRWDSEAGFAPYDVRGASLARSTSTHLSRCR